MLGEIEKFRIQAPIYQLICLPFHSTLKYQLLNSFEIRVQKKSNAISFFMRCFAQETLAISEKTHVKILQKLAKGTWEILGEVIQ